MDIPYTATYEEESSLFERRMKLAELIILTITALIIILTFTKELALLYIAAFLAIDLIAVILLISFGANKVRKETHFGNKSVDATKKDISYTLYWPDTCAFLIYAASIVAMIYVLLW